VPDVRTVTSVDITMINGETVTGTAVSRRALDPGTALTAATGVAAGLSVMSLWWAVPAAVAAFLAE
jgi:hypothetical protein